MSTLAAPATPLPKRSAAWDFVRRNPTVTVGLTILVIMSVVALLAPVIQTHEPMRQAPATRLLGPSGVHFFGTDMLGRDIFSRTVHGGQVSLIIGLAVALLATSIGLVIGLISGFIRIVDAVVMRLMDALMSIPGILLAIALVTLWGGTLLSIIIALAIPEVPRVVRLVRGVVLTLRDQVYVQAAIAIGTSTPRILIRHILPNTLPPLIVQATYICAQAILFEAYLSFIGAGIPPETPTWGNIMAEGRVIFQINFGIIAFPGMFLAITVFAINMLGDGLRDMLDPRLARRM